MVSLGMAVDQAAHLEELELTLGGDNAEACQGWLALEQYIIQMHIDQTFWWVWSNLGVIVFASW